MTQTKRASEGQETEESIVGTRGGLSLIDFFVVAGEIGGRWTCHVETIGRARFTRRTCTCAARLV